MISAKQLQKIMPGLGATRASFVLTHLIAAMVEFQITTRKRAAAFLAQLAHESTDLSKWDEDLNYSARRLTQVWPRRFPTLERALPYAHNPSALAEKVYGGRMGNTSPGDGWKFHGRCPIQATGKDMYEWLQRVLKLPLLDSPGLLLRPEHGFRAAAAIFAREKHLLPVCDGLTGRGDARDLAQFDKTTLRINGGYTGREDRRERYKLALSVLTDAQFARGAGTSSPVVAVSPESEAPPEIASGDGKTSQAAVTPEKPRHGQETQSAGTPAAQVETSLIDEIPVNEETKGLGLKLARKLGIRIGGTLVGLWGAGAGARLMLFFIGVCLVMLAYRYRAPLKEALVKILRKARGTK